MTNNQLYYGDNLNVLRNHIKDESVALCYIDPPFNSKRNYNMIYSRESSKDQAQSQAFVDTWSWDAAAQDGYDEIIANEDKRYTRQTMLFIESMHKIMDVGGNLAYMVSMAQRVNEIWRCLAANGSFYLHCDPTFSHYLKMLLDSIFCTRGGQYINEIVWGYQWGGVGKKNFARKHDTIFWYSKGGEWIFNEKAMREPYKTKDERWHNHEEGKLLRDIWDDIPVINTMSKERLGYATQKPQALLERIIAASSSEGDVVMDCYCGCGTTIATAQHLKRRWIGIDITYQSISVVLKRLDDDFGKEVVDKIVLSGIPRDIASAKALSLKKDDRVRKEFEKWAILTYSNNRAYINEKKGADKGIDGIADMKTGADTSSEIYFQVKSGKVGSKDIRDLLGTVEGGSAAAGIFITLESPTKDMRTAALAAGYFTNELTNQKIERIQIVEVKDILQGATMSIPMTCEVLKRSVRRSSNLQAMMML